MDLGLHGKYALVCAASKGLGKAIATALAKEGARLFLCARNLDSLKAAVEEIQSVSTHPIQYQTCDLTDPEDRERLVEAVKHAFPHLDILIHNVGGPPPTTVEETSMSDWERGFHQLFMSIVHLNQAFLPGMKAQRWGRIVNITSLSVMEPIPGLAVSDGMRPAIAAMSKALADEVASFNVTINSIAPGIIYTDRTEERIQAAITRKGGSREDYLIEYTKSIPAGRLGTPQELASAVCYLCSEQASYITGTTLCVDGGKRKSVY